jgi:hypothetical protein
MIGLTGFLDLGGDVVGCQKAYGLRQSKHEHRVLHSYGIVKQNPRVGGSRKTGKDNPKPGCHKPEPEAPRVISTL